MQRDTDGYYVSSPTGRYDLLRDGQTVLSSAAEAQCWQYLHRTHSFSVSHALRCEGYALVPSEAQR